MVKYSVVQCDTHSESHVFRGRERHVHVPTIVLDVVGVVMTHVCDGQNGVLTTHFRGADVVEIPENVGDLKTNNIFLQKKN